MVFLIFNLSCPTKTQGSIEIQSHHYQLNNNLNPPQLFRQFLWFY